MTSSLTSAPALGRMHLAAGSRPPCRPLVLAHRGSPGTGRPENTVAAVAAALGRGADGVEVDVRLSADDRLMCSHDPDLLRLAGSPLQVATSTARALREVRLPDDQTIALLEEVLIVAAGHGRRRVVIEAKACGGRRSMRRTSAALAEVLAGFDTTLDLVVSSFDEDLLRAVRSAVADLDVATALLGTPFTAASELLRRAVVDGHDEIHPSVFSVLRSPAVVETARSLGIGVACWTVNSARHVARLAALGVDALITDDPAVARVALDPRPSAVGDPDGDERASGAAG
ncbi:MAG: glycerophosphodiester phosphodiesterase [Jatrophihabitantaceae bacterium]